MQLSRHSTERCLTSLDENLFSSLRSLRSYSVLPCVVLRRTLPGWPSVCFSFYTSLSAHITGTFCVYTGRGVQGIGGGGIIQMVQIVVSDISRLLHLHMLPRHSRLASYSHLGETRQ